MPDAQSQVNHARRLRNNLGSAGETTQVVARIAVVMFNIDGVRFADNMPFWRQNFGERIPVIRIKSAIFQMFYLVVEFSEGCRITTAEYPGHSSPCATVNGLDDPKLSFFEPIKCHISSNSISVISPDTSGSGKLSP